MKDFTPKLGHVYLECLPMPEETESGLLIPGNIRGRCNRAKVLKVSEGLPKQKRAGSNPHQVLPGQVVLFNPHALQVVFQDGNAANAQGTPLAVGGDHFLIHENDIYGIEE